MVLCPICSREIKLDFINKHLDSCTGCSDPLKAESFPDMKAPVSTPSTQSQRQSQQTIKPTSPTMSRNLLNTLLTGNRGTKRKLGSNQVNGNSPSQGTRKSTYKYQPDRSSNDIINLEDYDDDTEVHFNETNESIDETQSPYSPRLKIPRIEPNIKQTPPTPSSAIDPSIKQRQEYERRQQDEIRLLKAQARLPLAERLRPATLEEYIGQEHLVGKGGILRGFIEHDRIPSLILWGFPGTGKTTLARIISNRTKSRFIELSATSNGISDCKKVFEEAKNEMKLTKRQTIVFVDEIHRFNKSQQDIFLPQVEKGNIILVGATTENPSFQLNSALLSRCRVFVLKKMDIASLRKIITKAWMVINKTRKLISNKPVLRLTREAIEYLCDIADGDSRSALNLLELVDSHFMNNDDVEEEDDATNGQTKEPVKKNLNPHTIEVTAEKLRLILKRTHMVYDRVGDAHYDTISAFHKSVRGNDPDAAMYYLARMLKGGESPLYIARRMIRIASEDVGILDDSCLPFAIATYNAVQYVGLPEADLALAHCAVKLSRAPKSVEIYKAWGELNRKLENEPGFNAAPIPMHLRNAPTKLMDDLGYSEGYKYPPNYKDGLVKQEYFPEGFKGLKVLNGKHLGDVVDPDLHL